MLRIQVFVFNPFQENTYVLWDDTNECIIVDPGCFDPQEKKELADFIANQGLQVQLVLNTHCHIDHVLGNYFIKENYGVKLLIPTNEVAVLKAASVLAPGYGFHAYDDSQPDGFLEDGDTIRFGRQVMTTMLTPGHSPGHVVFYNAENRILIGGDVLFYNSIGRTDLPGGNHEQLIRSIHEKVFALPDDVNALPGHGPQTTIGFEKRTNPFCALSDVNS